MTCNGITASSASQTCYTLDEGEGEGKKKNTWIHFEFFKWRIHWLDSVVTCTTHTHTHIHDPSPNPYLNPIFAIKYLWLHTHTFCVKYDKSVDRVCVCVCVCGSCPAVGWMRCDMGFILPWQRSSQWAGTPMSTSHTICHSDSRSEGGKWWLNLITAKKATVWIYL